MSFDKANEYAHKFEPFRVFFAENEALDIEQLGQEDHGTYIRTYSIHYMYVQYIHIYVQYIIFTIYMYVPVDVAFYRQSLIKYRRQRQQALSCPKMKDIGLLMIDSAELRENLLPNPMMCLNVSCITPGVSSYTYICMYIQSHLIIIFPHPLPPLIPPLIPILSIPPPTPTPPLSSPPSPHTPSHPHPLHPSPYPYPSPLIPSLPSYPLSSPSSPSLPLPLPLPSHPLPPLIPLSSPSSPSLPLPLPLPSHPLPPLPLPLPSHSRIPSCRLSMISCQLRLKK